MRAPLAFALFALSLTAPAHAWPPNDATYRGGCFLVAYNETTNLVNGPTQWNGTLGAAVATYAPTLGHNPVQANVTCEVVVNNAVVAAAVFAGTAHAGGAQPTTFLASIPPDVVTLCTTVDTTDAHGQQRSFSGCVGAAVYAEAVPQFVLDVANDVCNLVNDHTLCALLAANRARLLVAF